jgi:hypothetical protein
MLKRFRPQVAFAAVIAAIAVGAVLPASAAADTRVEIRIEGSGKVVETSGGARVNCSKTWDEQDRSCGFAQWPGWWWVELKAEAADGWDFAGWTNEGANLWCNNTTLKCGFTSDTLRSEATLTARFVGEDKDFDGSPIPSDCRDGNATIHPGAPDAPGDGIDQNCDGRDEQSPPDLDVDDDGFERKAAGGSGPFDCNDNNAAINPDARDVPENGVDEDCKDGDAVDLDRDGDGYERDESGGSAPFDCNDANKGINPGARDVPDNGVDEDCKDGDAVDLDRDRDGYDRNEPGGSAPFDCDDSKDTINPGMAEILDNGVDENCDGIRGVKLDRDGDGYDWEGAPGGKAPYDCDDANVAINPGTFDVPKNGVDENCDKVDADWPSITSEVRYVAKSKGGFARFRRLWVARAPEGATVELRCRGKGCTFARRRQIAPPGTSKISFTSALRRAKLRRGALLEIWVTRSGMRGKVVRLRVGRRGKVSGVTLCVLPGSKTPTGCPPA